MRVPPLLLLLGAPDGLAGDAEGPCHRGLGLAAPAQQPDGGGLVGGQCLGTPRESPFLGCPPDSGRAAALIETPAPPGPPSPSPAG